MPTGAQMLVEALVHEGVEAIFGYPGGAVLHIYDELWRARDRTLIAGDAFVTTAQESAYAALSVTQPAEMHGPPMYFTIDFDAAHMSVEQLAQLEPMTVVTAAGLGLVTLGATPDPASASSLEALAREAGVALEGAPAEEIAKVLLEFFPGVNDKALLGAAQRYQRLKIWKSTPVIEPAAMEKFQDILVQGHVLEQAKRVKFNDLVLTEFAAKAK